jgi:hypothetical protein
VTKDMTSATRKRAAMRATIIACFLLAGSEQMVYSAFHGELGPG